MHEVLEAVREATGHPIPAVDVERRAGDPPSLVASNALAGAELGWKPSRGIEQMAADAWAYAQSIKR